MFPLCEAVGPTVSVTAVDISPVMAGHLAAETRIGLTTFGPRDRAWSEAEDLLIAYAPDLPDPRSSGTCGPFATTATMAALLDSCGAVEVESHDEPLELVFPDVRAWRDWSMTLGMRQFWDAVAPDERDDLLARMGDRLEDDRRSDGLLHLTQQVRYTVGRAAAGPRTPPAPMA